MLLGVAILSATIVMAIFYGIPWAIEFAIGRRIGLYAGWLLILVIGSWFAFTEIQAAIDCKENPRAIAYEDDGRPVLAGCEYEITQNTIFGLLVFGPMVFGLVVSVFKLKKWVDAREITVRSH